MFRGCVPGALRAVVLGAILTARPDGANAQTIAPTTRTFAPTVMPTSAPTCALSCVNTTTWRSFYGNCSEYAFGGGSHAFCSTDRDVTNGQTALSACPDCGGCTLAPVPACSMAPTSPTASPTDAFTFAPTTAFPTEAPLAVPTEAPTTLAPTGAPTPPTASPTAAPTSAPTAPTTQPPTPAPTAVPTSAPTVSPTAQPSAGPTTYPTASPSAVPSATPTSAPTAQPSAAPTSAPTLSPTAPTAAPTPAPTSAPTTSTTTTATTTTTTTSSTTGTGTVTTRTVVLPTVAGGQQIPSPHVTVELRLSGLFLSLRELQAQIAWWVRISRAFDEVVAVLNITSLPNSTVTSIDDTPGTAAPTTEPTGTGQPSQEPTSVSPTPAPSARPTTPQPTATPTLPPRTRSPTMRRRDRRQTANPVYVRIIVAVGTIDEWELNVLLAFLSQTSTLGSMLTTALRRTAVFSTAVATVTESVSIHGTAAPTSPTEVTSEKIGTFDDDLDNWGATEMVIILVLLVTLVAAVASAAYWRYNKAYVTAVSDLTPTGAPPDPAKCRSDTRRELAEIVALADKVPIARASDDVCAVGMLEEHVELNRGQDALPYDRNRIVVNNGTPTGYINASLVGTLETPLPECFIAAQTPTDMTVATFWQMVWEYDASCVVGLSHFMDESDDTGVLPVNAGASVVHGEFVIVLKKNVPLEHDGLVRHELAMFNGEGQSRRLTALSYDRWPDGGVPESVHDVVELEQAAEAAQHHAVGPMVVHSAEGCGRVGCFVGALQQTRLYAMTRQIAPFAGVTDLRRARPDMVRTSLQFVFLHKVVIKAIMQNIALYSRDGLPADACDFLDKLVPTKRLDLSVPGRRFVKAGRVQLRTHVNGQETSTPAVIALFNDIVVVARVTEVGLYEVAETPLNRDDIEVTVAPDADWDECLFKVGGRGGRVGHVCECVSPVQLDAWVGALREPPEPPQGARRLMAPDAPMQRMLLGTLGVSNPFSASGARELRVQHAALPWGFDDDGVPHPGPRRLGEEESDSAWEHDPETSKGGGRVAETSFPANAESSGDEADTADETQDELKQPESATLAADGVRTNDDADDSGDANVVVAQPDPKTAVTDNAAATTTVDATCNDGAELNGGEERDRGTDTASSVANAADVAGEPIVVSGGEPQASAASADAGNLHSSKGGADDADAASAQGTQHSEGPADATVLPQVSSRTDDNESTSSSLQFKGFDEPAEGTMETHASADALPK